MVDRERETIVTTDGGRGGGSALAVVAIVLVLMVALFLLFGRGLLDNGPSTKTFKADIDVNVPKTGSGS
ncbi:MAG TPA: hypothetical protein VJ859_09450 [Allosphingosinicella sp.]|nr:hypothetical protein [Allosphingosinicella sp.]